MLKLGLEGLVLKDIDVRIDLLVNAFPVTERLS